MKRTWWHPICIYLSTFIEDSVDCNTRSNLNRILPSLSPGVPHHLNAPTSLQPNMIISSKDSRDNCLQTRERKNRNLKQIVTADLHNFKAWHLLIATPVGSPGYILQYISISYTHDFHFRTSLTSWKPFFFSTSIIKFNFDDNMTDHPSNVFGEKVLTFEFPHIKLLYKLIIRTFISLCIFLFWSLMPKKSFSKAPQIRLSF